MAAFVLIGPAGLSKGFRTAIITLFFINFLSKIFALVFLLLDDGLNFFSKLIGKRQDKPINDSLDEKKISRSQFLTKTALISATLPFIGAGFGIVSGVHDYRVRRRVVSLPNLPREFDGIRIAQISDIHSGSFFNKTAVQGGIDILLGEKADIIFFTGDLVNDETAELKDYYDVFKKVKAPMGVFSTLGNHDYGDYKSWPSMTAKHQNLLDMHQAHKELGWDLLLNENRVIEENGEKLAIIGVENWGGGRFAKYGKLDKAYKGSEEATAKLLLSHDPSHWDAQVRPNFNDIDLTFAGHTHGFQFGIEIGNFKWSPSQYMYKQWADLYTEGNQHLYVNRGFGFLGFPGRVGITPEITIITLKKEQA